MRLFDLLDKLMNNENLYAIKDKSMFGVRYRKHSGFMICGRDGTYVEHTYTFDKEMTEDDSWVITSVATPKYNIDDRFLLPYTKSLSMTKFSLTLNSCCNIVGKVIDIRYKDDEYVYTLELDDPLKMDNEFEYDKKERESIVMAMDHEYTEAELKEFNMVVSQNN